MDLELVLPHLRPDSENAPLSRLCRQVKDLPAFDVVQAIESKPMFNVPGRGLYPEIHVRIVGKQFQRLGYRCIKSEVPSLSPDPSRWSTVCSRGSNETCS